MKRVFAVLPFFFLTTHSMASTSGLAEDSNDKDFIRSLNSPVSDYNWSKTFLLKNGMKVTHKTNKIIVQDGADRSELAANWWHKDSASIFKSNASTDGAIDTKMSFDTFRRELTKVAEIIGVEEFDDWTKTFTLANGLQVLHAPDYIKISKAGEDPLPALLVHWFSKGRALCNTEATNDGVIATEMTVDQFTDELKKWSPIVTAN
jgi:hypothetical protein